MKDIMDHLATFRKRQQALPELGDESVDALWRRLELYEVMMTDLAQCIEELYVESSRNR